MGYPTPSISLQTQSQREDPPITSDEAASALQRVLESPELSQSVRMAEFLRFVTSYRQQSATDHLKQTVIGVSVFGRKPDYDPKADPVVRVEARRLRAKLQEYYSGSGAADPIRIELPKGGYDPSFVRAASLVQQPAPAREKPKRPGVYLISAALAAAITIAAVFIFRGEAPSGNNSPRLLTDRQSYTRTPRFSPDGSQIVFSREPGSGTSHIYTVPVSGGEPVAITSGPVLDYEPEWSHDGRRIAFLRQTGQGEFSMVLRDPVSPASMDEILLSGVKQRSSLAFSRDGLLLFANKPEEGAPAAIYSVSLTSRAVKRLTSPPKGIAGDASPQLSPDGTTLAFVRKVDEGVQDIYSQRVSNGQSRRLTYEQRALQGICWTSDGQAVLAALTRSDHPRSIWRFPKDGGEPSRLAVAGIDPLTPAVSPAGNGLAYVVRISDTNNWGVTLSGGQMAGQSRPLTSSLALDTSPQISPDGSQMVWRSDSTGTNEIWIASARDGANARCLTSIRGPLTGSPRWSPDGKQVLFESRRDGRGQIFSVAAAGGPVRQLTFDNANHILPSWSHDDRSVYFASDRSGDWQVWTMTAEGAAAHQVTRGGGFAAFEAWDGKTVYYSKQSGSIWKVAKAGGVETLVTSELTPNFWGQFALSGRALYYAVFSAQKARAIRRLDLATGELRDAVPLTRMPVQWDSGMTVSRDESFIAWSQLDLGASDIYVVDGFR